MTIEEKAPYLDRANKYWYQNTNIIGFYSKENELEVKNAYIDGLAEGQKENEKLKACIKRYEELENWVADFLLRHYKPIEEVKRMEELIGTDYFKEGIK